MDRSSEHVAIRLGYGLSAAVPSPSGPDDLLASVARAGVDEDAATMDEVRKNQVRRAELARKRKNGNKNALAALRKLNQKTDEMAQRDFQLRVARAVDDPAGFGERLVQFWADHFTVAGANPVGRLMATSYVNEAIRPHINGKFSDLLLAADTHPSMQIYLNQNTSVGPGSAFAKRNKGSRKLGLNENLAREMIELHSLGVGAEYSQKDVRNLALLLTGLSYFPQSEEIFRPGRAQPGEVTFLGKSYRSQGRPEFDDIREVVNDLAVHPATAQHLARKLAVHFVADEPPQPLVDRLADLYTQSEGDLGAVNAALTESPEVWEHFREKVRQPYDFVVSALRALGVTGEEVMALHPKHVRRRLIIPLTRMGQQWGKPIGPNGWPEDATDWITPQGLAARIEWAMNVPVLFRKKLPDARKLMNAALGDTASEALRWAVPKAETNREGVAIVLASADFNRR